MFMLVPLPKIREGVGVGPKISSAFAKRCFSVAGGAPRGREGARYVRGGREKETEFFRLSIVEIKSSKSKLITDCRTDEIRRKNKK